MKQSLTFRSSALIAGLSLLVMTIISPFLLTSPQATPLNIAGILLIIVLDALIGYALYIFLKPANRFLAQLTASLRIIYALIFFVALTQITDPNRFLMIWDKSLLLFGFHLLTLGLALNKASYLSKFWGYLLIFTSLGYLIDGVGKLTGFTSQFALFTFWGEVFFGVWLVAKGRKISLNKS